MTISKVESQEDLELPLFEFATIQAATDNFSAANKIGEGGFGPVYKVEICLGLFLGHLFLLLTHVKTSVKVIIHPKSISIKTIQQAVRFFQQALRMHISLL